ncbi:GntR family transcriptional regulator [Caproiciproducens sp.]
MRKNEKSKKQYTYEKLKEMIVTYELKPGVALVERQICALLNTSRTPVREAIQQLVSEGLVYNIPSQGSIVSEIHYEDVAKVYDVREYLEGLACHQCAKTVTERQVQEMQDILGKLAAFREEGDTIAMYEMDYAFHGKIVSCAQNSLLVSIFQNNLSSQIRRISRLLGNDEKGLNDAAALHKKILTAIENHDSVGAENAMRTHIRNSKIAHLHRFSPTIMHDTLSSEHMVDDFL